MLEKQRKIIHGIAFAIGVTALFLFFRRNFLWAGVGVMTMGVIIACIKVQGGELDVIIGLMPILIYFEQRMLLVLLSLILVVVGLYDFLMIFEIRKELEANGEIKDRNVFRETFRQKELVHQLFVKLGKLLGIN